MFEKCLSGMPVLEEEGMVNEGYVSNSEMEWLSLRYLDEDRVRCWMFDI